MGKKSRQKEKQQRHMRWRLAVREWAKERPPRWRFIKYRKWKKAKPKKEMYGDD